MMLAALIVSLVPTWTPLSTLPPLPPLGQEIVRGKQGKQLDQYLRACAGHGYSCSVYVSLKGKPILVRGYGSNGPGSEGVSTETRYDLASASKHITAAAILKLVEAGVLDLDDSVAKWLPNVPNAQKGITLRHLLHHTSGYPRSVTTGGSELDVLVQQTLGREPASKPGRQFAYWNGGYNLLAAVVEHASEASFESFVKKELFEPVGLSSASFLEVTDVDAPDLAVSPEGKTAADYIRGWGYRGAGGVLMTAQEAGAWFEALLREDDVLEPASLKEMLRPDKENYALGLYVFKDQRGREVIQHGGSTQQFGCYLRWFPKEEALFVVLGNQVEGHWQLAWGLEAELFGHEHQAAKPPLTAELSGRQTKAWEGSYRSKNGREVELAVIDGRIQLKEASAQLAPTKLIEASHRLIDSDRAERKATVQAHLPPGGMDWSFGYQKTWERLVRERGAWLETSLLGTERRSGGTNVWLELRHEQGTFQVKVGFNANDHLVTIDHRAQAPKDLGAMWFVPAEDGDLAVQFSFDALQRGPGPSLRLERSKLTWSQPGEKDLVLLKQ